MTNESCFSSVLGKRGACTSMDEAFKAPTSLNVASGRTSSSVIVNAQVPRLVLVPVLAVVAVAGGGVLLLLLLLATATNSNGLHSRDCMMEDDNVTLGVAYFDMQGHMKETVWPPALPVSAVWLGP